MRRSLEPVQASLASLISLFWLACSPTVDETPTSDTSSSETSATTTAGEVCEPPVNATSAAAIPIRVTNERTVPIYVTPYSSFSCNYGKVEIELDGEPVLWHHGGTYAYDCSSPALCNWGCSDGGAMGWIIHPGETAELEWGGGVWLDHALSEACKDELDCSNQPPDTCSARENLDDGREYLVRAYLSDECPVQDECAACTEGVCEVFFYEPWVGAETESVEVVAEFPAGAEIVVN